MNKEKENINKWCTPPDIETTQSTDPVNQTKETVLICFKFFKTFVV